MNKPPSSKKEFEAYLKENRRKVEQAAAEIFQLQKNGDKEAIVRHANRDAEAYAEAALRKRDQALQADNPETDQ